MVFSSRRRRSRVRNTDTESSKKPSDQSAEQRREPRTPPWQTGLEQAIERYRTALSRSHGEVPGDREIFGRINDELCKAEKALSRFRGQSWLVRHTTAGAVYEQVLSYIQVASEDLLLIEDEELVRARIPAIRAAIKTYLGADDPRFDNYIQFIDNLLRRTRDNGTPSPFWSRLFRSWLFRRTSQREGGGLNA